MEKEIIIARHGQTDGNVGNSIQRGVTTVLNEVGLLQAEELADMLESLNIRPQVIKFSPLVRTTQTAEAVHKKLGGVLEVEDALEEEHFGSYEGQDKTAYRRIQYGYNSQLMQEAGGDTPEGIENKVKPLLDDIFARPETSFLLVTHAFIASILVQMLLDEPRDFEHIEPLANADFSYLLVEKQEGGYILHDIKKNVIKGRLQI